MYNIMPYMVSIRNHDNHKMKQASRQSVALEVGDLLSPRHSSPPCSGFASTVQWTVTGILVLENIGPGPFFSEITLKILVQGYNIKFRWTKISLIEIRLEKNPFTS